MLTLPSLLNHTVQRPGSHDFEPSYLVPKVTSLDSVFWDEIYYKLKHAHFDSPVEGGLLRYITPHHGYFGFRPHPSLSDRMYFHIGIELSFSKPQVIHPVSKGILEYSGYGAINGYYVLISHPEIRTKDGYILHSMYCHLKKPLVGFSSYQKMLREVSLGSYPIIPIDHEQPIGKPGSSGVVSKGDFKLYLQFDFRKYGETPIVVDPLRFLTGEIRTNDIDSK